MKQTVVKVAQDDTSYPTYYTILYYTEVSLLTVKEVRCGLCVYIINK
jgi:hypothetical protein